MAAFGRPLQHDAEQVSRRAQELVTNPPYAEDSPGVIARILGWLGDRIASLLADSGLGQGTGLLAWVVVAIAVAGLVVIVWRLTRDAVRGDSTPAVSTGGMSRRAAAAWHQDADDHEAEGLYTEALRARYAAMIVSLIDRNIVDDRPGRTVGELDAEVAFAFPALAPDVIDAGARFQNGVYGRFPVSQDDLDRVRATAYAVASPARARRAPVAT